MTPKEIIDRCICYNRRFNRFAMNSTYNDGFDHDKLYLLNGSVLVDLESVCVSPKENKLIYYLEVEPTHMHFCVRSHSKEFVYECYKALVNKIIEESLL